MEAMKIASCLIVILASKSSEPAPIVGPNEKICVKIGDDVLLSCLCLRPADVTALKWSRSNMSDYVFFYRDRRAYEHYQNLLYLGRVKLVDPLMSSRNLSVILSNATLEDTGTFYCNVGLAGGQTTETLHTIYLQVAPPTDPADGSQEDRGSSAALMVGVTVAVVLLIAAVIFIRRRNKDRCPQDGNDSL